MDNTESAVRMEDLFAQFVDSGAMALLISTTPPALLDYALTVYRLNEIPIPEAATNSVDGQPNFQTIHIPFTEGFKELSNLDSDTSNEDVIKHLAKIDGIIESLTEQYQQNLKNYIGYFAPLRDLPLIDDINLIRQFYNAGSLSSGFCAFSVNEKPLNILPHFPKESQRTLHHALACQMAGLHIPAEKLFDEFFNNLFTDINLKFEQLLNEVRNYVAHSKKASDAAKAGNDSKHLINRKLKEAAIKLYRQGSYDNPRHAANVLLPKIAELSEKMGSSLEWKINGFTRLYNWLRTAKKESDV
jgi:hypothetical protein